MISAMSGGMPSLDAMRQMQQKMFSKADADASGGLDATEFESMMKASPMGGGQGAGGLSTEDAFKRIDGDGNGQLSQAEMEEAHQQMMARMQSTVQAFGGGETTSTGSAGGQSTLDALLRALGQGEQNSDRTAQAIANTDDLMAQLRAMADKVSSAYGGAGFDGTRSLLAAA